MGDSRRVHRMAQLIRSELSRLLIHEVSDPRLREVFVTDVDLSRDLRHACVFISTAHAGKEAQQGLRRAVPFFRRRIGDELKLRYVPELEFRADTHADQAMRVESLLGELHPQLPAESGKETT